MLDYEFKTEAVEERLKAMEWKIKAFGNQDMPQGLTDWQTEDMRRKYPETEAGQSSDNEYTATTMIYPRSRTYEQTHPHRSHPVAKAKPALSSMPRLIKSAMSHPILRQVLFDMLHSRMVALLSEKITWR